MVLKDEVASIQKKRSVSDQLHPPFLSQSMARFMVSYAKGNVNLSQTDGMVYRDAHRGVGHQYKAWLLEQFADHPFAQWVRY